MKRFCILGFLFGAFSLFAQDTPPDFDACLSGSSLIFKGKVMLSDSCERDFHGKPCHGHVLTETSVFYRIPWQMASDVPPELYVHYLNTRASFHPQKGKEYIFFAKTKRGGPGPDYQLLFQDSVGAFMFTKNMERELVKKLFSQKGDSASCQRSGLDMEKLNLDGGREEIVALMRYGPPEISKKIIPDLLCILQSDSFTTIAKLTANWLLGYARAEKAVPLLLYQLGRDIYPDERNSPGLHEAQAYEALYRIGKPAYAAVENHLDSCRDYQELKMTLMVLHWIKPFRNGKELSVFAQKHYKKAPEKLKPLYAPMMVMMYEWEQEVMEFNDRLRQER